VKAGVRHPKTGWRNGENAMRPTPEVNSFYLMSKNAPKIVNICQEFD
jgi:hypothetical protein